MMGTVLDASGLLVNGRQEKEERAAGCWCRARGMMWATRLEVTAAPALNVPVTGTARCPVISEEPNVSTFLIDPRWF